jgi:NAD(P)-dependent dehydrogenase (short-subunit alcohol dehydrogenase family)
MSQRTALITGAAGGPGRVFAAALGLAAPVARRPFHDHGTSSVIFADEVP